MSGASNYRSGDSLSDPAHDATNTWSLDTTFTQGATRGVFVGADGNLTVLMISGTTVTFTGVKAGTVLPIRCTQIKTATTVASPTTNLVPMF